ncbi:protein of unknown function [Methylocella tundrae]|uniref:Uncharacterized protein n=1 Tax=Methylocella tundrae TaxID=227605 RepID=A0A4U8YV77_METTU|nr:protein of unknown function [Methylocella tundrae]
MNFLDKKAKSESHDSRLGEVRHITPVKFRGGLTWRVQTRLMRLRMQTHC